MDEDRETLDMGRPTTGLIDVNLPNPTEEIITESPTKAETTDEMMAKFWKDMGITPPIEGDVEPNDKIIKEVVEPNEIKIEEEVEPIEKTQKNRSRTIKEYILGTKEEIQDIVKLAYLFYEITNILYKTYLIGFCII